ncbi:methyl-accepting chemotaxis protein [Virgibacillus natechei]|uniref:Methyl-accepting chemotaxis protein n=1 Tax=Virgibacillus natechei TaxID=1216297 RepID=A0ABS4IIK1_9BACI|nr:hypothetical protein [Virgibacillus natechei]MBP1970756.1 methyl-accepting chemotaxis protein [Virgibacillus natechei]UZD12335.1 hypothetical protein OLD84_15655 [Virgibacillus natechei]
MDKKEFSLRNIGDNVSEQDREEFIGRASVILEKQQLLASEAVHFGSFIFLPEEEQIKRQSNMQIIPIEKKRVNKIDHISKLENRQLEDSLKKLKEKYNLRQRELEKIVRQVKNFQKELSSDIDEINKETKTFLEESTRQAYVEKQIKNYVKKVQTNCDKLTDCLFLEDPSILSDENKSTIINKVSVLQNNMNKLIEQLSR